MVWDARSIRKKGNTWSRGRVVLRSRNVSDASMDYLKIQGDSEMLHRKIRKIFRVFYAVNESQRLS